MTLVVDLDTQRETPTKDESLRIGGNLVTPDGQFAPPELVQSVGIGTRVKMVFNKLSDDFALPQWTIDPDAAQPDHPWRYPQEG